MKRTRMIFDLSADVVMAIKLRAVKDRCNTGVVVENAVCEVFPNDVEQARREIEDEDDAEEVQL